MDARPVIVAIHQPNFFPWLGYFDKIARADHFIVLDDAQFPRGGGTWANRVRCLIGGKAQWLTAPVDRDSRGGDSQIDVRFSSRIDWRGKICRTIQQSYARAPFFRESFDIVEPLIRNAEGSVAAYNVHAIATIASALGLDLAKVTRSSALQVGSTGTERLIDLTKAVGGDAYLCGGGAGGYQDDEMFAQAKVELLYQQFRPASYQQVGSRDNFVPGLSIIDPLCNLGVQGTRALLIGSAQPASSN